MSTSANYDKFRKLLSELFMFDQADLDFGIYRIMNAKRDEITHFLAKELLPQVRASLGELQGSDRGEIEKELEKAIAAAKSLGVDPETSPKVKELRARMGEAADLDALESEVFSDLYSFFRRYYDQGDFISLRRYKEGIYAIPYEGEEVKMHWANHDQYYIKTTEYFRDYAFRLKDGRRAHFKLMDADTEKDNNREPIGKERRFILWANEPLSEEGGELIIRFEYRPDHDGRRQADLNADATRRIFSAKGFDGWTNALAVSISAESESPILDHYLNEYTARNTFDYFIHKDLGAFLRRELDFYLKNEVMHLDDVENETAARVDHYLAKLKAIRRIAHKIIDLLAQLENFQKRLWLKKKFVVETNYCITISRVPETMYAEIAANDAQREEWVRLFAIDDIKKDLNEPGYSKPLKVAFLKAHPTLVLDTRHFDKEFSVRLLRALDDIDRDTVGVVVHSENFQALNLLLSRYRDQVRCIYIDPPYNTDASAIDYKNGYKASSWISLVDGRVRASRPLLRADGVLVAAIDDEQQRELSFILSGAFDGRLLGTFCVRANPSGRPTKTGYSVSHEYLYFAGQSDQSAIGRMPPTAGQMARFNHHDEDGVFEWRNLRREGSNSDRSARRALYYPIFLAGTSIRIPNLTWNDKSEEWIVEEKPKRDEEVAWPDNEAGEQKTWRWEWTTVLDSLKRLSVRKDRSGRNYVYYKRRPNEDGVVSVSSWFDAKYSATEHGTAVLKALFGRSPFSYPKSIHAVTDAIYIGGAYQPDSLVLDYFGGSGTTGHAVINLNRLDGGKRKFILVEVGAYIDTALLPRIKKVAYTPEWKDGKPVRFATDEESANGPSLIKYIRLESYEDALNNLEIIRSTDQGSLLTDENSLREDYILRYMLTEETKNSPSLLNVRQFEDPSNYKMKIGTGTVGETKEIAVDLIETFNLLLGLQVKHFDTIRGIQLVLGKNPAGERVLVLWRNTNAVDSDQLDQWFAKQKYNTKDQECDIIYVNGDNNLENLRRADQTWKVRLIEDEFHRLMFDVKDV